MMVVDIKNIVTRLPELRFTTPVNWRIDEGQQWAVIGPNGAGKTLIADIMQRKFAFKEGEVVFSGDGKVSDFIKSIAFKIFIRWRIAGILITNNVGIRQRRRRCLLSRNC